LRFGPYCPAEMSSDSCRPRRHEPADARIGTRKPDVQSSDPVVEPLLY